MQTANLIVSCASLLVSTATLVALLVITKKAHAEVDDAATIARTKAAAFRRALEEI